MQIAVDMAETLSGEIPWLSWSPLYCTNTP
jgi:hypothetical protein